MSSISERAMVAAKRAVRDQFGDESAKDIDSGDLHPLRQALQEVCAIHSDSAFSDLYDAATFAIDRQVLSFDYQHAACYAAFDSIVNNPPASSVRILQNRFRTFSEGR